MGIVFTLPGSSSYFPGVVCYDITLRVLTCVETLESWLVVTHASIILPSFGRAHRYACTHAMV